MVGLSSCMDSCVEQPAFVSLKIRGADKTEYWADNLLNEITHYIYNAFNDPTTDLILNSLICELYRMHGFLVFLVCPIQ